MCMPKNMPTIMHLSIIRIYTRTLGCSSGLDKIGKIARKYNLKVAAGEIIAIVGVSGAGKTTLVNLIPRFYEVSEGDILIDGVDIRDVNLASLRAQIGIVTQQTILFNDTVRNNIAYGDIRKSEELTVDLRQSDRRVAHPHDFYHAFFDLIHFGYADKFTHHLSLFICH
ncbi:MAG: ATP-binding cassette domain-containing protein [Chloroflexi bacterium]|nr:ATP-binding cassette domain-containing protein [Chloroflexota bacterium]